MNVQNHHSVKLTMVHAWFLILALGMLAVTGARAEPAGKVLYVKGVATAHQEGQSMRFLGKGMPLDAGDILTTSPKGFVIIETRDQGKITLRPNTVFTIEKFEYKPNEAAEKNQSVLRLFKGGLRAVTGLITKRNPKQGMRVVSPVATLGIRGTEFDTRLCNNDCAQENEKLQAKKQQRPRVVGRIAFARGTVQVHGGDGASRKVVTGASLFRLDEVETAPGSSAVIVFRDNTRVTVRPSTSFKIDRFRFRSKQPERNNVALNLLRGGLRVVTGLVSKREHKKFRLTTPVAVVGVRGTNFDVRCEGDCAAAGARQVSSQFDTLPGAEALLGDLLSDWIKPAYAQAPFNFNNNLAVYTRQGETNLQLPGRNPFPIPQGRVGSLPVTGGGSGPRLLPSIPQQFVNDQTTKPETVAPQPKQRFGTKRVDTNKPGQYTTVYRGDVDVNKPGQPPLNLGQGESGFTGTGGDQQARLPRIPKFIFQDNTPVPDSLDTNTGTLQKGGNKLEQKLKRETKNECS